MRQLTYCTNIHPGETWGDVLKNLTGHTAAVKKQFSPSSPFPLGLRISHQASLEIGPQEIRDFHDWCETEDCYLLTINGFPYGTFHQQPVKAAVYDPDWRTPARVIYTKRLADLAVALITRPTEVSISTVPIAFKPGFDEGDWPLVRENLVEALVHLERIFNQTGIRICLALEPEPYCVLETMAETVNFFARMALPESLRDFIGICVDCCHQAVEFEDPRQCLEQLRAANIKIAKVQVSSALRAIGDEITQLINFDEPIYLHQVVAKSQAGLQRFADLPDFKRSLQEGEIFSECRVHFHVPIFLAHLGHCGTTQFFLEEFLPLLDADIPLEIETYSFNNLPENLRQDSVSKSLVRELCWVRELIGARWVNTPEAR